MTPSLSMVSQKLRYVVLQHQFFRSFIRNSLTRPHASRSSCPLHQHLYTTYPLFLLRSKKSRGGAVVSTPDLVAYVPYSSLVTYSRFSYTLLRVGRSLVRIQLTVLVFLLCSVCVYCAKLGRFSSLFLLVTCRQV